MPDTHFLRERDHAGVPEAAPEPQAAQGYVGTFADAPKAKPDGYVVEAGADGAVVVRTAGPAPDSFTIVRDADGNVTVRGKA